MKTGIVLETDGQTAVLLKADGTFTHAPAKAGWRVGEAVALPTLRRRRAFTGMLAACLALVLLGGFGWQRLYAAPVALISIDVNPSIELSVNRFHRIVSASALGAEGEQILTQTDIKHAAYQQALSKILSVEEVGGYFAGDASIVVTVFSSDAALQSAMLSEVQALVEPSLFDAPGRVTAEYYAVDAAIVDDAHCLGVTAGKYLYLQELLELAPETDMAQCAQHSIDELKDEINSCRQNHGAARGGNGDGAQGRGNGNGNGNGHGHGAQGGGHC